MYYAYNILYLYLSTYIHLTAAYCPCFSKDFRINLYDLIFMILHACILYNRYDFESSNGGEIARAHVDEDDDAPSDLEEFHISPAVDPFDFENLYDD